MAEPDLYELFAAEAEPDARAQARLLANAIRGQRQGAGQQRAVGNLGLLTGDRVLSDFGRAQVQQAGQQDALAQSREGVLPEAGKFRLQRAMQQKQFAADEAFRRAQLDLAKGRATAGAERDKALMDAAKQKRGQDLTSAFRKEFLGNPVVKATQEVAVAYDKMRSAAADPSPAGDLSLIFAYMKMLDPGSTVREGEFANAQNATGVPGQIVNMYNRALRGERLAPDQRNDFLSQAGNLFSAQMQRFEPLASQYVRLSSEAGLDPSSVVLDLGIQGPQPEPASGALLPPEKQKRLEELRRKRAAGEIP